LIWLPAHRTARLAAEFDRKVALHGWTAAIRWALPHFVESVRVVDGEHLPATGPLLVASNHPGSYDVLVISSVLARDDLSILVSDVPILRKVTAASSHFIYTDTGDNSHARMGAVRQGVQHLRAGGALLVFPSGQVDPDPAFLPGTEQALEKWSSSLSLFLRQVPETRLLVTIVDGVLSPTCFYHPLTRLRREQRLKQFLAEFLQVGQQVMFNRRFGLSPRARFAKPLTAVELGSSDNPHAVIVARAQELLAGI
jgi:hypothetical protein